MTQEFIDSYTLVIQTITNASTTFKAEPNVNSNMAVSLEVDKKGVIYYITVEQNGGILLYFDPNLVKYIPAGSIPIKASPARKGLYCKKYGHISYTGFDGDFKLM
jgi:hypothetical protein